MVWVSPDQMLSYAALAAVASLGGVGSYLAVVSGIRVSGGRIYGVLRLALVAVLLFWCLFTINIAIGYESPTRLFHF